MAGYQATLLGVPFLVETDSFSVKDALRPLPVVELASGEPTAVWEVARCAGGWRVSANGRAVGEGDHEAAARFLRGEVELWAAVHTQYVTIHAVAVLLEGL